MEGNSGCGGKTTRVTGPGLTPYLEEMSVGYWNCGIAGWNSHITDNCEQPPLTNPTPNSHQPIDRSSTGSIKRPTRSRLKLCPSSDLPGCACHTPHTALTSPPFPCRPATSIPMDHHLEGLHMENNRCRTQGKRTEPSRRMSFLCNVLQRLLTDLM